jgi:hypothetical protein
MHLVITEMLLVKKIRASEQVSRKLIFDFVFRENFFNFSYVKLPLWQRANVKLISLKKPVVMYKM